MGIDRAPRSLKAREDKLRLRLIPVRHCGTGAKGDENKQNYNTFQEINLTNLTISVRHRINSIIDAQLDCQPRFVK